MNAIGGVGGVAEALAWIVLMIGLPLLALGLAYVSPTDPPTMRLQRRRPITSVCLSLGTTLAIIGLCALVISFVLLFIP